MNDWGFDTSRTGATGRNESSPIRDKSPAVLASFIDSWAFSRIALLDSSDLIAMTASKGWV
jgi:hypothetical protein